MGGKLKCAEQFYWYFFQDYDFDENVYHNDDGEEEGDTNGGDGGNKQLNKQGIIIFGNKRQSTHYISLFKFFFVCS